MESYRGGYDQLKIRLEEALLLVEASYEASLLDALRKISGSSINPLRAYVLGDELVVAVSTFSLVGVNLKEGRVRTWDDWRERLRAAARAAADEVSKKLLTLLLDKGEEMPSPIRGELSRVIASIEKSEEDEFRNLLVALKEILRKLSQSG